MKKHPYVNGHVWGDIYVKGESALSNHTQFLSYFSDLLQRYRNLLFRMGSHQGETDQGIVGWNRRAYHRVHEDTVLKEEFGEQECLLVVADEERDDWCLGVTDLESQTSESVQSHLRDFPEAEEFRRRGGVMVWDERDEGHGVLEMMNGNLGFLPGDRFGEVRTMRFERAVPGWYRKLRGAPKTVTVRMRLIYPEPADPPNP